MTRVFSGIPGDEGGQYNRADNGDLPDGYTPPASPAELEEALRVVS